MSTKVLKVTYDADGNVESKELATYPNKSLENAVTGLSELIKYFYIEEGENPTYDSNEAYTSISYELTSESHETYTHLLIATKTYTVNYYSSDVVIEKLATSLGSHLDTNYPEWKRTKHLREYLNDSDITDARKAFLESLFSWEDTCRTAYDERVLEYTDNGTFPSFLWDEMPTEE